jgi:hypothetical protein
MSELEKFAREVGVAERDEEESEAEEEVRA